MVRYLLSLLATATLVFQSHAQTQFEWVSPQPHRQDWLSAAFGNGVFVGLTDGFGGRYLYTSRDGETWTRPQASISGALRKVIFAEGKFIVVGDNGQILTSADGTTWSAKHAGSGALMDVAFGNGVTVVAENAPHLYYSHNHETWTEVSGLGTGFWFAHVEFGNGIFLATTGGAHLWKSVDGVSWTQLPWPHHSLDGGVAFSAGRFVMGSLEALITSADGETWTPAAANRSVYCIMPAPGGFLALSGETLVRSADATTWETLIPIDWRIEPKTLAASDSKWLILGQAGCKLSSTDGWNWTSGTNPIDYDRGQVAFANGNFIKYGEVPGLLISTNGAAWEEVPNTPAFRGVAGGNGVWVGVSADGSQAFVSNDARQWTSATGLAGTLHKRVVFGGGVFAIGASAGIATSTDGRNWTMHSVAGGGAVTMVGYLNGRFAAHAADKRAITSDDGVTWTAHEGKFVSGWHFAAGNDRFVGIWGAGMGWGNVAWSLDGINWFTQRLSSGSTHSNDSLSFGAGAFLQTDYYGNIYESRDGIAWTGQRQAPQNFSSSACGNGAWVVVGGDSILRSAENRLAAVPLATRVELRADPSGQFALTLTGSANRLLTIRHAASIDGQWSDVTTVRLSAQGSAIVPVNAAATHGFFSATALLE